MIVLWGSVLSPFALKVRAMLQHARLPHRFLPGEGSRVENVRLDLALRVGRARGTITRHDGASALDELPLVPFVHDGGRIHYDSTAIGLWLHDHHRAALLPQDPAARFLVRFVDEAFDELGLYLLHHNRWVVSARDNDAAARLAREYATLIPPGGRPIFEAWFARRQTRRLRYLFSVEPGHAFPSTHALLEDLWGTWVDGLEALLSDRPYLLGERFTLADASVFGHVGGNFIDPSAHARLKARAPNTWAYCARIWRGEHVGSGGTVGLDAPAHAFAALLARTFVPLMRRNEEAYLAHLRDGERTFNEPAFDRGRALYDGTLDPDGRGARPFRSVAKTFQVRVWRDLVGAPSASRSGLLG